MVHLCLNAILLPTQDDTHSHLHRWAGFSPEVVLRQAFKHARPTLNTLLPGFFSFLFFPAVVQSHLGPNIRADKIARMIQERVEQNPFADLF